MDYYQRSLERIIEKMSSSFRVILLTGQRQVGKSTMLRQISCNTKRGYITLDNLLLRKLAQNDPELFLQQYTPPLIIDEIQYAPQLFSFIKIYCDENPDHKGAFWLSGSQKYRLMEGVNESLAGRIGILDLFGFSFPEKMKNAFNGLPFLPSFTTDKNIKENSKLNIKQVFQHIWEGSLPEVVVNKDINIESYYSSYIKSYIERDVRDFYNIEKPIQFFDFLSLVATNTGQLINYSSLARDVRIDVKTAQSWMGILEKSGLVFLLHPYFSNISKRIVKSPKIFFLDTGLCSYLTRWTSAETLMNGAMAGKILETYVISEILKSYYHNGKEPNIWFYRDTEQREIDLIIEENGKLYPIEIKKTANPDSSDCSSFKYLEKFGKDIGLGAVICLQPERIPITRDIVSIPVWEI